MQLTKENAADVTKSMFDEIRPILIRHGAMDENSAIHVRTNKLSATFTANATCTPDCVVTETIEGPPGVFTTVSHCVC
jgi:hypothetical protein